MLPMRAVVRPCRPLYLPPPGTRTVLLLLLAAALAACAPRQATVPAEPAAALDTTLVDSAETATRLTRRLHVTFDWALQDRDARFRGQGVVRLDPPYRGRLDLFGPRGETYAAAVLEDAFLRAPAGAAALLPPPAFLWASLGVFRRPDAPLTLAHRDGDTLELGFAAGRERWNFRFEQLRLHHVEWVGPDGSRRTVELAGEAAHRLPQRGTYRDWQEFRELALTLTTVEEVDAFPADIWRLGAR